MTYFGDTFYFLALLNPSDNAHVRARSIALTRLARILTTEWVLTELADCMNAGQQRHAVITLVNRLPPPKRRRNHPAIHDLFTTAWDLSRRLDKEWSLADCSSFVVMQRHGFTDALTGDRHFEQADFNALLK